MKKTILIFCLLVLTAANLLSQENNFLKLTGPYLGQTPPGDKPEKFAPGLISTDDFFECCRAISSDGREFFFVRGLESGDKIFRMTEGENGWTEPALIKYTDKAFQYSPFISPDGDKFMFMAGISKPKMGGTDSLPEVRILTRKDNDWESQSLLGTSIGGAQPFYITMAQNSTLYFSCKDRDGIYKSEYKDSRYLPAEKLPDEINYLENVSHPFIAPDESYLIVQYWNKEANNSLDLYISFRKNDGTWTKAINMGDKINSTDNEMCPSVSNDGKYIFLGRLIQGKKTDIYWVDAKIINELKPKEFK